jgi:hypothetical protein
VPVGTVIRLAASPDRSVIDAYLFDLTAAVSIDATEAKEGHNVNYAYKAPAAGYKQMLPSGIT